MLDEVKRRAILDVFVWPWSLGPTVLGFMGCMAGWANDGPTTLVLGGAALILAGIGITASRFMLGMDSIMEKAWENHQEEIKQKKKNALLALRLRMEVDSDARTTKALDSLMTVYAEFVTNVKEQQIPVASRGVLVEKVDRLFEQCVKQLERCLELHKTQASLRGPAKAAVKAQREKEVKDVVDSIAKMEDVIASCVTLTIDQSENNLTSLSEEMEQTMEVAARTTERLRKMGISSEGKI